MIISCEPIAIPFQSERTAGVVDTEIAASQQLSDQQRRKDCLLEGIKRASPKANPKAWDDRAEQKLREQGW
jgi:hypothetical protein